MVIFHSYVSLPEGKNNGFPVAWKTFATRWWIQPSSGFPGSFRSSRPDTKGFDEAEQLGDPTGSILQRQQNSMNFKN